MEAKDLRIGNWVKDYEGKIGIVNTIEHKELLQVTDEGGVLISHCEIELYEPIPLTEEILLKCGFDKIKIEHEEFSGVEYELSLGIYSKILVLDDFSYSIVCKQIEDNSVCFDKDILTSLHQLQNLYFALTQTELKIEL